MAALVGGGLRARPGEVSLAHNGVLFLDELPEFQPAGARQPAPAAGDRRGGDRPRQPPRHLSRPLPAGGGDEPLPLRARPTTPGYTCRRGPNERCKADYQARLSGPLLDRIDLPIDVPAVTAADLMLPAAAEGSPEVAARVAARAGAPGRALRRARACRGSSPTPRPAGAVLDEIARPDRARASRCCARRPRRCGCPPAAITGCSRWPAPSPTSTAPTPSAASTSPRRCPTAAAASRLGAAPRDRLRADDKLGRSCETAGPTNH